MVNRLFVGESLPKSPLGYKRTYSHTLNYVRFTPESRHHGRKFALVTFRSRLIP